MILNLPGHKNLVNINCLRISARQPKKKLQQDSDPGTAGERHKPHEPPCRMRKQMQGGEGPTGESSLLCLRKSIQIVNDSSGRDCCREVRGHGEKLLF